jgi:hypothetical protein
MSDTSRRGFLAIAGVGAAGVAVASVAGASAASSAAVPASPAASQASTDDTALPANSSGSLVAYVNDVHDGRISVMVGEREVVIRDRALVAKLARAAKTTGA